MFESVNVLEGVPEVVGALVVGQFQGEALDARTLKRDADGSLKAASTRPEATGELGKIAEAIAGSTRVIIVGLGKKAEFKVQHLRAAAAAVGRRVAQTKDRAVEFDFAGVLDAAEVSDKRRAGQCIGEAMGLLGWVCDEFRGKATTAPTRAPLSFTSKDKRLVAGMQRGVALAVSTNFARTLSQTPPNVATPMWMAERAKAMGKECGLKVDVMAGKDLEKERFEGLINVGKASENKPCMIRLEYRPKDAKKGAKPLVLIGKTMCYDSGGLSLKINNGMVGMKRDKDGGCAVLGAMHAIATVVKPRTPVVALLAAAENSISDEAYRPDDVLRYRNGVTVEITNTDAEGRLVLADALCWACEKESPAAIIDLATLTGGVIVALGSTFCGMFCDDDKLRARVEEAAAESGERVWRLPMHAEYRDMMKSPIADILNSNPNRKAHAGQGAAFLSYFVENGVPWCHLDIAGVHVQEKDAGMFIDGPTGWGVRLLAELVS